MFCSSVFTVFSLGAGTCFQYLEAMLGVTFFRSEVEIFNIHVSSRVVKNLKHNFFRSLLSRGVFRSHTSRRSCIESERSEILLLSRRHHRRMSTQRISTLIYWLFLNRLSYDNWVYVAHCVLALVLSDSNWSHLVIGQVSLRINGNQRVFKREEIADWRGLVDN